VSGTVTANNRLCGYATDYGRLAPLFSVRAFSLPWLAVELNPLNSLGGRGTLAASLRRVAHSCRDRVYRHVLDENSTPAAARLTLTRRREGHYVHLSDATMDVAAPLFSSEPALCLTDPPYFDFISYDTFSQIFRAWQPESDLGGAPLLPNGQLETSEYFGRRLGHALSHVDASLAPGAPIVFTFKGSSRAWQAISIALDQAKLRVTALWPVLADPHMGHHSDAGNCEYDMVIVARPAAETIFEGPSTNPKDWLADLDVTVSAADQRNMRDAFAIASTRWGRLA
jgi:putative DNA methylase